MRYRLPREMLRSLYIRNFRVFRELEIPRLAAVNLIVGRNNAGKTCLLEALRLHGERASAASVLSLLRGRDELFSDDLESTARGETRAEAEPRLLDPARALFHGYEFPAEGGIEIGPLVPDHGAPTLRISVASVVRDEDEDGNVYERLVSLSDAGEDAEFRLVVEEKLKDTDWERLRSRRLRYNPRGFGTRFDVGRAVHLVGSRPSEFQGDEQADQWRRVAIRPEARHFVTDALRLVDRHLAEFVVLPPRRRGSGMDVVLMYDGGGRAPLKSLGTGSNVFLRWRSPPRPSLQSCC